MKKVIIALSLTGFVMISCQNKTIEAIDTEPVMAGYASMYDNNYNTDHSQGNNVATLAKMGETKKPVVKTVIVYRDAPSGNNNNNNATASTTTKKKKGWSNAAKGTVIGAGSGAILGAVVSKNKAAGAVLGGLLGAGAGYVVGNEIDKKKNRKNQ